MSPDYGKLALMKLWNYEIVSGHHQYARSTEIKVAGIFPVGQFSPTTISRLSTGLTTTGALLGGYHERTNQWSRELRMLARE